MPFNPDDAKGAPAPGGPTAARPPGAGAGERRKRTKETGTTTDTAQLTVSQVADLIKSTLEQHIASPLRVIGEVSNLSTPNHWYFSLKDDAAVVSCAAWASAVRKFPFTPKEGDEIIATGHVSHYPPQGRTQFYVSKIEPVGAGALELRFRAMCDELRRLGYFDEARKRPLPAFPRRIAVITSAGGAAAGDVINTAAHRCRAVGLIIVDVRVQGESARHEIARAIRWADQSHQRLGVDAILVTRGGGSMEDLWAFNERIVADAAFNCSIPLVAAIGHESDTTVIELVADLRASTPTQAAMRLIPDAAEMHRQVTHHEQRLRFLLQRCIEQRRERLEHLARHEALRDPMAIIRRARQQIIGCGRHLRSVVAGRVSAARSRLERAAARLAHLKPHVIVTERHRRVAVMEDRLSRAVHGRIAHGRNVAYALSCRLDESMAIRIERSRERISAMSRELAAIDPRQVLKRGYSYTTREDGSLVRSIRDVSSGQTMLTNVADGSIRSVVGGSSRRPRRGKDQTGRKQMDLFGDE